MIDQTLPSALLALSRATSLKEIGDLALMAAKTFLGADGVTLVLREGELCHYADERAISPLWKGMRFPMSACISGWVMNRGEQAMIPDILKDERIPQDAYRPTFVKSLCMTPVGRQKPIAAIGAYWQEQHEATEDQRFLLRVLSDAVEGALLRVQSGPAIVRVDTRSILSNNVVCIINPVQGGGDHLIESLKAHGATVFEVSAAAPDKPEVFPGVPSIAIWNHASEKGNCVYREIVQKLHEQFDLRVPFLHLTDGSCNFAPDKNLRRCVAINLRVPNFTDTFPHIVAGVVSARMI